MEDALIVGATGSVARHAVHLQGSAVSRKSVAALVVKRPDLRIRSIQRGVAASE